MRLVAWHFLFWFIIGFSSAFAQTYSLDQVPNPKTDHGGLVSDPGHILSTEDIQRLEQLLKGVEKETSAQAALVILSSIGDQNLNDFAQQLFEKWGIGQKENNNGLLVLLVLDIRSVRTHTGYGLEGILPDAVTKRIQMEKMLPYFREENYGEGLYQGMSEMAKILSDPTHAEEVKVLSDQDESDSLPWWVALMIWVFLSVIAFIVEFATPGGSKKRSEYPSEKFLKSNWLVIHLIIPSLLISSILLTGQSFWILFLILYGYELVFAAIRLNRIRENISQIKKESDLYLAHQYLSHRFKLFYWYTFCFPIPMLGLLPLLFAYRNRLRNEPRPCKSCGKILSKLSETEDDVHLSEGKRFEEQIKSVDYDVWSCRACGSQQVYRFPGKNSFYEECPKCEVVAYYVSSLVTIRAATTSAEGMKEETKTCKYCGLANSRRFTIPKIEVSSGSSGGDSGGGSFGGGRSGGGGSSSSW